ncbi:MAG: ABC transporter ATP-binding protein [Dethiobacter sp.]|jgi:branched-chain amino acid transport system ATP-binding protein|nr:MAG: ABC transporter ATP-binding protein [Dethiobacter sp.]
MIEVKDIHTYYGLSHILFGVSLQVNKEEIVCILGRNGAGKTTTMRSIMGLTPPRQGSIIFKGEDITRMPVYKIARLRMGFVPDNRRIFPDLTVGENLEIASKGNSQGDGWDKERVYRLFPALKAIDSRKGGFCSGGEQQMLSIARALMGNPEFLLLDEPTEGLAPLVVRELMEQIGRLREEGLSILMAEQNVKSALKLADRVYVIDRGQIRFQGSVTELEDNEEIRKKYLLV